MNDRERFIATLLYQKPDRIPFEPGGGRKSTREAWYRQGLPSSVKPEEIPAYIRQQIGILPAEGARSGGLGVDFLMRPQFEEKVLERRPGTLVVQDWKGNVCEISDEFDVTYLRTAIDFVTRKWIKCPVETHADWEEMKKRYCLDTPGRIPTDLAEQGKRLRNRTFPTSLVISGPFWQLREWLGFEGLCMLFLDDPDFVREMVEFWDRFAGQLLERIFEHHAPDMVMINEDMAYKVKPMIGPDMSREFLLPCWRHWGQLCKQAGVPVYGVDSDGYVGELIPVWIEAGMNFNAPLEVAAGNDLPAYHRQFGKAMAYSGGVDKRAMAKGGQAIRDEIDRLMPAIKGGGYLPSCDHGVPPDVSWPNFLEYSRLLARATGWL
jgi:uroporphyrinogen decarboxylase